MQTENRGSSAPFTAPRMRGHWRLAALLMMVVAGRQAAASPPPSPPPEKQILVSRLAGGWYPSDPAELRGQIDSMLAAATPGEPRAWRALILPHAGYAYAGPVAAAGIRVVQGAPIRHVILMGTAHRVAMPNGISLPSYTHIATPLGELTVDQTAAGRLAGADPVFQFIPAAHEGEHSVQVLLPMIQVALPDADILPLVVGQLDLDAVRRAARALAAIAGPDTLVVASTDFTHYGPNYGYVPFTTNIEENLRALDMGAYARVEAGDAAGFARYCDEQHATICGRHPVEVLLSMLAPGASVSLLKYDTSGHVTGDFLNSVSYFAIGIAGEWPACATPPQPPAPHETRQLAAADREALLRLARFALDFFYVHHRPPTPSEAGLAPTPALLEPGASFVTLTRPDGSLRGCIGDLQATGPLQESVIRNALAAATRDWRFAPVAAPELPGLHIEISVLTPPVPVDGPAKIVLGQHGIILNKDGKRAVFLPQVAPEQGWTLDQTLDQLAQKAGLPADAWRDGARFEVFEAIVFGEDKRRGDR